MEALAFTLTYIVPAAFAATGAAIVAASALKAAGRNPEKINDCSVFRLLMRSQLSVSLQRLSERLCSSRGTS